MKKGDKKDKKPQSFFWGGLLEEKSRFVIFLSRCELMSSFLYINIQRFLIHFPAKHHLDKLKNLFYFNHFLKYRMCQNHASHIMSGDVFI